MMSLTDYRSSVRLQEFSQITESLSEYVSLRLRSVRLQELSQITEALSDYRNSPSLQKLSQVTGALSEIQELAQIAQGVVVLL